MNRSKRKGTDAENAVVQAYRDAGWTHAERRALGGSKDRGDIAGVPDVVTEVKNAAQIDLAGWIAEAEAERRNDGASLAVVWAKRRGKSDPKDWYVVMEGRHYLALLDGWASA